MIPFNGGMERKQQMWCPSPGRFTRATDVLVAEHSVIQQVLDCLEKMAEEWEQGGESDWATVWNVIGFQRRFSDRCHREKEERCLLPKMAAGGFVNEYATVRQMLYEHEVQDRCLEALVEAVQEAEAGGTKELQDLVELVHGYIFWVREHIAREENHLFPLANEILSEPSQIELLDSFQDLKPTGYEEYLHLAHDLGERFGVGSRWSSTHEEAKYATCSASNRKRDLRD